MMIVAAPLISAAIPWYGWSTWAGVHWIVPIVGLFVYGVGYTGVGVQL
jgi:hypothetical protein